MVDEVSFDDADYIFTDGIRSCVLDLKPVTDPATAIGQSLTIRARSSKASTLRVTVLQAGKIIAVRTYKSLPVAFATYVMNLDQAEIALITKYTNLSVKLEAIKVT
jgi:hypothetical protein